MIVASYLLSSFASDVIVVFRISCAVFRIELNIALAC